MRYLSRNEVKEEERGGGEERKEQINIHIVCNETSARYTYDHGGDEEDDQPRWLWIHLELVSYDRQAHKHKISLVLGRLQSARQAHRVYPLEAGQNYQVQSV